MCFIKICNWKVVKRKLSLTEALFFAIHFPIHPPLISQSLHLLFEKLETLPPSTTTTSSSSSSSTTTTLPSNYSQNESSMSALSNNKTFELDVDAVERTFYDIKSEYNRWTGKEENIDDYESHMKVNIMKRILSNFVIILFYFFASTFSALCQTNK